MTSCMQWRHSSLCMGFLGMTTLGFNIDLLRLPSDFRIDRWYTASDTRPDWMRRGRMSPTPLHPHGLASSTPSPGNKIKETPHLESKFGSISILQSATIQPSSETVTNIFIVITCHHISSHVITCHHMSSHVITYHHMSSHIITCHHISSHVITYHHMSSHIITCHHILSRPNWRVTNWEFVSCPWYL